MVGTVEELSAGSSGKVICLQLVLQPRDECSVAHASACSGKLLHGPPAPQYAVVFWSGALWLAASNFPTQQLH